jgi:hypothetical protein
MSGPVTLPPNFYLAPNPSHTIKSSKAQRAHDAKWKRDHPPDSPAQVAKLREDYLASAPQRREQIMKTVTDPHQRMIALQKFDEELNRITKEGIAKREKELEGLFGGRRKTRRSKKTRKTRRRRA